MDLETFVTLGLGDNSYLVASGSEAAAVDPQRDAWRFLDAATRRGWRIRHVLETHVHNDYVSGALEIRAATGAEILVADRGRPVFPHRAIEPGDGVELGDLRLRARGTPGHTFEHVAWEVVGPDRPEPRAVFSGGSLLVGSAGRTDLLGESLAEGLARAQYRSINDLATLPDDTVVLPTHGAGSFCVANAPSAARASTIGEERLLNAALRAPDEDSFVRQQLAVHTRYPAYYPNMAPLNRAGPRLLGALPSAAPLAPDAVERLAARGAWVVDARDRDEFAAGHIPGSLNIELNEGFGTYVGWMVPFGAQLVLIVPEPVAEGLPEAIVQLVRIGYEQVAGFAYGGIEAWRGTGRPLRSYPVTAMKELFTARVRDGRAARILDVRQPAEWRDDGSLPDSLQVFVADIPARLGELPRDEELWVVCTTGHRAAIAASLLDRAGIPVRLVSRGGTVGWIERFEAGSARPVSA